MEPTPDTFNYLVAGYVVFTIIMAIYIASLVSRWNNLKREQQMLSEIDQKK